MNNIFHNMFHHAQILLLYEYYIRILVKTDNNWRYCKKKVNNIPGCHKLGGTNWSYKIVSTLITWLPWPAWTQKVSQSCWELYKKINKLSTTCVNMLNQRFKRSPQKYKSKWILGPTLSKVQLHVCASMLMCACMLVCACMCVCDLTGSGTASLPWRTDRAPNISWLLSLLSSNFTHLHRESIVITNIYRIRPN